MLNSILELIKLFMYTFLFFQLVFCIKKFFFSLINILIHRKDFLMLVITLEILLLSVNMLLIFFSIFLDDISGQVFTLFFLSVKSS